MKYFIKLARDSQLESLVATRMALEASKYPKQVQKAKVYNTVKSVPFAGAKVESMTMDLVQKRHGPMVGKVLGGTPSKKTMISVGREMATKAVLPTQQLQRMHSSDSTRYVNKGGKYPKYLDTYFKSDLWKSRSK